MLISSARLQRGGQPSSLSQAIAEIGRIGKTLHLLAYIEDEDYRRHILRQINRGEARHRVARVVFFGGHGELRQRYREGQEDQLGALGLVVNAVVLWNTRYMEAGLDSMRAGGRIIEATDVRRLSPLVHSHLNVLGRYHFGIPASVREGNLRPLRSRESEVDEEFFLSGDRP